jgi:RNA polymerase sigma-70 factor (ECF subfamily)
MGGGDSATHEDTVHRDLVERARHGDRESFSVLADASMARLLNLAQLMLTDGDLAEDAVQEALIVAWRDLRALRDPDRFDAWLNRILMNRCRDLLRSRRRSREIAIDEASLPQALTTEGALDISALTAAFERLDIAQRQLLVLHHLHHEPLAQIARRLGIPLGTAKSRLHAARKALERALEKER